MFKAGTYTEFLTVFCNVFLGMQPALSSYLQVCFSITNDVVMSISLMYEKPESGEHRYSGSSCHAPNTLLEDLMLRKPRNARTDRLTDWRFFFQIYLVCAFFHSTPLVPC